MYKTYTIKKRTVIKNRFRFTVFIILAAALISMFSFAFIMPSTTNADITHKTETVYVSKGDTMWSIASTYCSGDVRENIYKIKKLNNMKTGDLSEGQSILIPVN